MPVKVVLVKVGGCSTGAEGPPQGPAWVFHPFSSKERGGGVGHSFVRFLRDFQHADNQTICLNAGVGA